MTMEDRLSYPQTRRYRTWYGLPATVILVSEFGHKSGLGRWVVSHPAAANWLLRRGLSKENAIALSFRHEFGHAQTLPLALLYAAILVSISASVGAWIRWPAVLIGSQAAWEIMAEGFTLARRIESYRAIYSGVPKTPRFLFWLSAASAASAAVFILVAC